ncbi:DUF3951 domain-containing protein [Paenibacillus melissococcoides]|nr:MULTISPECIES: DUF3951 domain-containing protein [Paenibacillus]MEB9894268.1 DUF3951 domain-containing protein [Bacillus cereus]GIO80146.1 hypothetical protein J6TS7_37560 [Paenibacillus dendritiformis]CAH8704174.1 DUF3951 domain-containing protein [Paenibacillus melissococcoides]CAH8706923.1 DUF3951 domain-containing protein [Paenibacillus melissococcoides]
MDAGAIMLLSLIVPVLALLGIISAKIIAGKALPDSNYTPFDNITGQSEVEFHEEKQEKEEDDDLGDDKEKNRRNL